LTSHKKTLKGEEIKRTIGAEDNTVKHTVKQSTGKNIFHMVPTNIGGMEKLTILAVQLGICWDFFLSAPDELSRKN
jgi:hypothetical protein